MCVEGQGGGARAETRAAARPCGGRAPGSRGGGGLFSLHSCVRRKNRKNRVSAGRAILIFVENVRAVDGSWEHSCAQKLSHRTRGDTAAPERGSQRLTKV